MASQSEIVELPTGVSVETVLHSPRPSNLSDAKLAVLLHPWSWLGGQMNDPVLRGTAEVLKQYGYHVLRYNSRGVGKSTGWASLTGFSEGNDLEALVQWCIGVVPNVQSLLIVGYSHGALIASLHPVLAHIPTSHILISYPLGTRGLITLLNGKSYAAKLVALVQDPNASVLLVYGDHDEFTGVDNYERWVAELAQIASPERVQMKAVIGASHFWHGSAMNELQEHISKFLQHY